MKPIAAAALLVLALPEAEAAACRPGLADPSVTIRDEAVAIERSFAGATLLAEALLRDTATGRTFVSARQGLFLLGADGALSPWGAAPAGHAVQGLALDETGGAIWAVVTATAGEAGRSALIRLDRRDGRLLGRFALPGTDQWYGDVAAGADGTVYVGNPRTGAFYRLRPGGGEVELMIPPGRIRSPQGMVVEPGGARLIVADYARGLAAIDLGTNRVTRLAVPAQADLSGIDGIAAHGSDLIAFQNGAAPYRVLRLALDPSRSQVVAVTELASFAADVEPTLGAASGAEVLFVARSSWAAPPANPRTLIGRVCAAR